MAKPHLTTEERFWSKVDRSGDCWLWTGGTTRGYGMFHLGPSVTPRQMKAHRFSWVLAHGQIDHGLCVCHRCDRTECVRPDHLFLGTSADNTRDAVTKRRVAWGERNAGSKLTEHEVTDIRDAYLLGATNGELAARFGVSSDAIRRAVSGARWSDVGGAVGLRVSYRLSDDLADAFRNAYAHGGTTVAALCAQFGISKTTAYRILRGTGHYSTARVPRATEREASARRSASQTRRWAAAP